MEMKALLTYCSRESGTVTPWQERMGTGTALQSGEVAPKSRQPQGSCQSLEMCCWLRPEYQSHPG